MKTLKRISSLLITLTLIMSLGLCAFAETFALDFVNVTTKVITLSYTANVSGTPKVYIKENGEKDITGGVVVTDNKITVTPSEALDLTKEYVLEIGDVTDGTTTLPADNKLILFDVVVNDDFNSYNDITDLDSTYYYVGGSVDGISSSGKIELVTVSDTDKRIFTDMPVDRGIWVKSLSETNNYKYLNLEVDLEYALNKDGYSAGDRYFFIIRHTAPTLSGFNDFWFHTGYGVKYNNPNSLFSDTDALAGNNYGGKNEDYNQKGNFAFTITRDENNTKDVYNMLYNSQIVASSTGTLKSESAYHILAGSPYGRGRYYIDNYKLYSYSLTSFKAITPVASGKFEENEEITVSHEEPVTTGFTTTYSYEWLKSNDVDKEISQWESVGNDKNLTLTSENCNFNEDYFVCRVTRTMSLNGGSYQKVLTYVTDPICKPFSPICKDVVYTYDKGENASTLKAIPTYFDQNGDVEDKANATFTWEISDDNETWKAFEGTKSNADNYNNNVIDVTDIIDKYVRCSVVLKAVEGKENTEYSESYTKAYTLPFKPVAKDVAITGTGTLGNVLKATYTYYDENGDKENIDKTEKVWYRSRNGIETKVGVGLSYTVTQADAGHDILFKVTPVNDTYPEVGDVVTSTNTISVGAIITGGSIGGGSFGGSSGGGSYSSSSSSSSSTTPTSPTFKPVPEEKAPAFSDIKGHWAKDTIEKLNEMGLVNGKANGFEPDSALTRAEWVTLLLRAIGADFENVEVKGDFEDVNADDWFAKAVQFAYDNKLANGADGKFDPNANVTREQMAKMLVDVLEYFLGAEVENSDLSFTDNDSISDWAEQYVQKAVSKGLITGTPEGAFNPSSQATRAEACTVLLRLLNVIGK